MYFVPSSTPSENEKLEGETFSGDILRWMEKEVRKLLVNFKIISIPLFYLFSDGMMGIKTKKKK